jgi:hypothetical protein
MMGPTLQRVGCGSLLFNRDWSNSPSPWDTAGALPFTRNEAARATSQCALLNRKREAAAHCENGRRRPARRDLSSGRIFNNRTTIFYNVAS